MRLVVCFKKWLQWAFAGLFAAVFLQWVWLGGAHAGDPRAATHTVQSGDSLSVVAERHGVSLSLLRKVNQLADADQIRAAQVLLLPRLHEVKAGEVLGTIAERYGVALNSLYQHNDLHEKSVLRVGQKVVIPGGSVDQPARVEATQSVAKQGDAAAKTTAKPEPNAESSSEPKVEYYEHKVRAGEVLSKLALRYAASTQQLRQLNRLGRSSLIRVGQRLKIPVNDKNLHLTRPPPPKPWHKYARKKFKRGYVTLNSHGRKWKGQVLDENGRIRPRASRAIHSMLGAWQKGKRIGLSPRLIQLIVEVSNEFGGRPIRVVSGYREFSHSRNSKHRVGHALDFSIPGVPNSAVVDFLLTLPKTGVGYYPNSTHVHLDARSYSMYWVDVSRPGQAPRYVHKSGFDERASSSRAIVAQLDSKHR